jgi:hypothetical protein
MTNKLDNVAQALIRHLAASEEDKDTDHWAWQCVEDMIDEGDALEAWSVILRAIQLSSRDREVRFLGAGVLESLLVRRGPEVIDAISAEAAHESRILTALRAAYLSDADESVRRRVEELGGPQR